MTGTVLAGAVPLAEVVRGELVESVHLGHLLVLGPDGEEVLALGEPDVVIWPRSSVKPLQLVAMLRSGLDLPDRLLALSAASHNGEPMHLEGVREILGSVGLTPDHLRNTPDMPLHAPAAFAWQLAGHLAGGEPAGPASITQNCSGKHAAMLATCVAAGWPVDSYLDPTHPLQQTIAATILELTGDAPERLRMTVDGCGAPLYSTSLRGLARAFGYVASAPAQDPSSYEARAARAINAYPEMVGGTDRDVTLAMQCVPGLVAKDGADGVYAAGLPDGSALAFKVLDGDKRPRPGVLAAALRAAGVDRLPGLYPGGLDALGRVAVLGGGHPVGEVRPVFDGAAG